MDTILLITVACIIGCFATIILVASLFWWMTRNGRVLYVRNIRDLVHMGETGDDVDHERARRYTDDGMMLFTHRENIDIVEASKKIKYWDAERHKQNSTHPTHAACREASLNNPDMAVNLEPQEVEHELAESNKQREKHHTTTTDGGGCVSGRRFGITAREAFGGI